MSTVTLYIISYNLYAFNKAVIYSEVEKQTYDRRTLISHWKIISCTSPSCIWPCKAMRFFTESINLNLVPIKLHVVVAGDRVQSAAYANGTLKCFWKVPL